MTKIVNITPMGFEPTSVTIRVDDNIAWNAMVDGCSTTSDTGEWDSGVLPKGATYSLTFGFPGTYHYYCSTHSSMMKGSITVMPSLP
jgi:plastocyanin